MIPFILSRTAISGQDLPILLPFLPELPPGIGECLASEDGCHEDESVINDMHGERSKEAVSGKEPPGGQSNREKEGGNEIIVTLGENQGRGNHCGGGLPPVLQQGSG